MEFRLEQELYEKSESLKKAIATLEKRTLLKITSQEDNSGKKYIVLSLQENSSAKDDKQAYDQVLLENTQMKLLEDFFNEKVLPSSSKQLVELKALYVNYVSSSRLNKKFGTKQSLALNLSQNKEEKSHGFNVVDEFSHYLEEKEARMLEATRVFKSKDENMSVSSLKELDERLKEMKDKRNEIKDNIVNEKLKTEYYVNSINEKVNQIVESLCAVSKFKATNQTRNEDLELFYQKKLLENLKLYREVIEKKILSDLYTEDQIAALKVVRDGVERKVNLLVNNKNYVDERLREIEKQSEDEEFVEAISKIIETNKTIKRREEQLRKIKELDKL